jgi:hypothetical protein
MRGVLDFIAVAALPSELRLALLLILLTLSIFCVVVLVVLRRWGAAIPILFLIGCVVGLLFPSQFGAGWRQVCFYAALIPGVLVYLLGVSSGRARG